jgi:long-chain acyl-CoA synthetase
MSLNVSEFLFDTARIMPGKKGIICEDMRLKYGEVAEMARRVSGMLRRRGIGRGDVVALMLPNTPQFAVIYYGILQAGAVALPLNPMLHDHEIAFRLNDCGAKALFVWKDCAGEAASAITSIPSCTHFFEVEAGMTPSAPETGDSFVREMLAAEAVADITCTQPEDTAVILYTSAAHGVTAGVELTHFNLFQNASAIRFAEQCYRPEDVGLGVLPLFHSYGQTTLLNAPILAGGTIVLMPRFETHKLFEIIRREGITLLRLVPVMFHLMAAYRPDQTFDLSSVREAVSGGAALPAEIARNFEARFGIPILEGYGLTETSPVVSFNHSPESSRPGSIGAPIFGVHMAVMREDGTLSEAAETGEIVVRGHNVMKGYLNHPELTAEAIRDGWLHTRDLGYRDRDGWFYLTGLKKDLIICSGMNVWPYETEQALLSHPDVEEAAVIGMPDPVRGENVKGVVRLRAGAGISGRDLIQYCRGRIAAYKCPRKIEFTENIPKDGEGRVHKGALRGGYAPGSRLEWV